MAQGADSAVNAEHKAAETALPDGYRVLDDSVGAKRVDPPDGYRWVANSDGEAKLQSLSDGKIYESRKEVPENSSADSGNSEGAGGVKEAAKVTAETEIGGQKISGINQTARDPSVSDPNKPTLIGDKIQAKIDATGKPLPNGNMSTAHAEIEVIQKAFDAGLTKGHDMTIKVTGQPVCSYCRSDIRAMADKAGLNKIEIYETTTGKTLVSIRQPNGSMSKMSEK
ncbi:cytidine deaminase-like fold-containing protein [Acetobacter sp.]|uniref:cytidine deaminase-like fold-containing protein n=1 Tax=Acetobacter sp. TaxID=440 RepID=UPI0025C197E8|nr:deaminase [Acetobacter sp.]MCH4091115.1 deaminase [Acetobacter sp.]MCI1300298.1 deaminase [Acetobacter sp.]MCI1316034.1 deaminase [Acetobacter sp.]